MAEFMVEGSEVEETKLAKECDKEDMPDCLSLPLLSDLERVSDLEVESVFKRRRIPETA